MRTVPAFGLVATLTLLSPLSPPAAAAEPKRPAGAQALSAEERQACASDLEVLDKRAKLFDAQGLPPAEIARRNESAQAALAECLRGFRLEGSAARERAEDVTELERRTKPSTSDEERAEIWNSIRRERLSSKPLSKLTADERAELAAGNGAELAETHALLDNVHGRDPGFMRTVYSALNCYHAVRRDRLRDDLRREESLLKIDQGDRKKVYVLKSDLRTSDEVLARSREAAKGFRDGLGKCTEEQVAVLAHCLAIRFEEGRSEPACEAEEIQQYIRLIK
jgi:hypothetical protein